MISGFSKETEPRYMEKDLLGELAHLIMQAEKFLDRPSEGCSRRPWVAGSVVQCQV